MKASYGQLDEPEQSFSRHFVRNRFFEAIETYASDVCTELYGKPLARFDAIPTNEVRGLTWEQSVRCSKSDAAVRSLHDSLREWSETWNLDADWCRAAAYFFLQLESLHVLLGKRQSGPGSKFHYPFEYSGCSPNRTKAGFSRVIQLDPIIAPPEGFHEYWPMMETRDDYLQELTDGVREAMEHPLLQHTEPGAQDAVVASVKSVAERYCEGVEKYAQSQGLIPVKSMPTLLQKLEWTVNYQVKGRNLDEIGLAGSEAVSEARVSQVVTEMLELLDLKKRQKNPRSRTNRAVARIMR
jgi:hypothetical protein